MLLITTANTRREYFETGKDANMQPVPKNEDEVGQPGVLLIQPGMMTYDLPGQPGSEQNCPIWKNGLSLYDFEALISFPAFNVLHLRLLHPFIFRTMEFIEYINNWASAEVQQGRVMMGVGLLVVVAFVGVLRSENEMFRGALIPLGLLVVILVGYGAYILQSRPAHAKSTIAIYEQSAREGIVQEKLKHLNDNKSGKTLLKLYPIFAIIALTTLFFGLAPYYIGLALGFTLLFIASFIIDSGFVARSDLFLDFLNGLP